MVSEFLKKPIARITGNGRRCQEHDRVFLTEEGFRRHREVEHDEDMVLFRCTECGKVYQDLGSLHGHAEKHTSFWSFGNVDRLMEYTEKLRVTDHEELDPKSSTKPTEADDT